MTVKWSAFSAGSAIQAADQLVGLQSGVNVRWTFTNLNTYLGITFASSQVALASISYNAAAPAFTMTGQTGTGISWSGNSMFFSANATSSAVINSSGIVATAGEVIGFAAGAADAGPADTAIYRNAAGVFEINNGSAGTFRDLKLRQVLAQSGVATPAAASAVASIVMGSALVGIYWGTGDPNTALTAPKGSLFIRTDGSGVANRMYINTDASTAWTSFATAG